MHNLHGNPSVFMRVRVLPNARQTAKSQRENGKYTNPKKKKKTLGFKVLNRNKVTVKFSYFKGN